MRNKTGANTLTVSIDSQQGIKVRAALSAEPRVRLLNLLSQQTMNINEIADALGVTQPTASSHVRVLQHAGLIVCEYMPINRGSEKRCWSLFDRIVLEAERLNSPETDSVNEISMPIGMYTDICVQPTCGLAAEDRVIGFMDAPQTFYLPDRSVAELLWLGNGYVEYAFPLSVPPTAKITSVEFVAEVCSETPGFDNEHASDITVWINGVEVGTWTCPGDFGGKRGKLTPSWWNDHMTQYGAIKVWSVTENGGFIDGVKTQDISLSDINLACSQPTIVRIGIKPDALFCGGMNLFGKRFGNYPHDLIMRIRYELDRLKKLDQSAEQLISGEGIEV